jgi:hypothetical protein
MHNNDELCRIYRQNDGYPSGHGYELAELCDRLIVNGYSGSMTSAAGKSYPREQQANGMGCLAASVIAGLKDGIGGTYIERTGGEINDWCEYIYIVRGKEGDIPTIECTTQTGPWPFNAQEISKHIFTLPADQVVEYVKKIGAL